MSENIKELLNEEIAAEIQRREIKGYRGSGKAVSFEN